MDRVRRLTDEGLGAFARYLGRLRRDGAEPPPELLTDPTHSQACVLGDVRIEPRGFGSRREFAEYIDQRFVEAGVFADADETGMWEWLSLFYFDAVCPKDDKGMRKPGADGRHLLGDPDARRRHRHLLRGPYMLFRRFRGGPRGELDLVLGYGLPVHGVAATHLVERPRLVGSPGALIAASRLYVDPATRKPIRGYTDERTGLRAYCKFLNNLPECFDLSTLSPETVVALLPREFAAWLGDGRSDGWRGSGGTFGTLCGLVSSPDAQVVLGLDDLLQGVGDRPLTERQAVVRSDVFRTAVLGAYQSRCAVSGVGLRQVEGGQAVRYEVEAAHIVPVSRGGRDLVQNGLALTRTLHWAFDQGMVWVDDGLRVRIAEGAGADRRNDWLNQFRGRPLWIPPDAPLWPHRDALRWHATHIARSPAAGAA